MVIKADIRFLAHNCRMSIDRVIFHHEKIGMLYV